MQNYIDITGVVLALFTIFGFLITTFLIPMLKTKLTNEQTELIKKFIETAVISAETLITGTKAGRERFNNVIQKVSAFCEKNKITFNKEEVTDMIQSAWYIFIGNSDINK